MEEHIVKIISIEPVTHDVLSIKVEKPDGYSFVPGQATEISINKDKFKEERRPFTFTSLNDSKYLEFTIKTYTNHNGVTNELRKLKVGDELILHDVWGAISYKGEGVFIAGGAGVTPFIAIFRQLYKDGKVGKNKLFFSNKTSGDIILKDSFEKMLGDNFLNTLTQEKTSDYMNEKIDKNFLEKHIHNFSQNFYICGPDAMVQDIQNTLKELGANENVITVEV